jgi:hypothetical protein
VTRTLRKGVSTAVAVGKKTHTRTDIEYRSNRRDGGKPMRMLRMTVFLGLVGLAWKWAKPKLPVAKAQIARARERIEPALRDATTSVRTASKDAAESVRDVSLSAAESAESVANAVRVGGDDAATSVE